MSKHTIHLPSGRAITVNTVFDANKIGVCLNDFRSGYVVTDLTTNHTFADRRGEFLTFDTPEQASAFLGVLLVTSCSMTQLQALQAIRGVTK